MSDDRAILDESALAALNEVTGGDVEFFAELVETFLEDAPNLIREMESAFAAGNAAEVRRLSHGLKSNGNDFGATDFAQLCAALEHQTAGGNLDGAGDQISAISREFARVKASLEARINGG